MPPGITGDQMCSLWLRKYVEISATAMATLSPCFNRLPLILKRPPPPTHRVFCLIGALVRRTRLSQAHSVCSKSMPPQCHSSHIS